MTKTELSSELKDVKAVLSRLYARMTVLENALLGEEAPKDIQLHARPQIDLPVRVAGLDKAEDVRRWLGGDHTSRHRTY